MFLHFVIVDSQADISGWECLPSQFKINAINKVYQFSRMYWKSVNQKNLPVTIKYREMVAKVFPYSDNRFIPAIEEK